MKKINLGFTVKTLDGRDITISGTQDVAHAGWYLAQILVSGTKGQDALKFYDWALKFHNKETVEVDNQDFKKLYKFIEEDDKLTVLIKAQIIIYLDSVNN